jgi:hypothetical protein
LIEWFESVRDLLRSRIHRAKHQEAWRDYLRTRPLDGQNDEHRPDNDATETRTDWL